MSSRLLRQPSADQHFYGSDIYAVASCWLDIISIGLSVIVGREILLKLDI